MNLCFIFYSGVTWVAARLAKKSKVKQGARCIASSTKRLGTVGYMSPEILRCDSEARARARRAKVSLYGKEVDCWAIGVLVYECLFECMPWEWDHTQCEEMLTYMTERGLDFSRASKRSGAQRSSTISSEAMSFISSCLDMNPQTRITVQQMSSHPWITGMTMSTGAGGTTGVG